MSNGTTPNPGNPDGDTSEDSGLYDSDYAYVIDQILTGIMGSPDTPLGNNFLKEYGIDTGRKGKEDEAIMEVIAALDFLMSDDYQQHRYNKFGKAQAWKYVYFPTDIRKQAELQTQWTRVQTKNLLAQAGLIDLSKSVGGNIDDEYLKGIKLAMEFSMNNGGQMSWIAATKLMASNALSQKAFTQQGEYTFTDEALDDMVKDLEAKAKYRKAAPLSDYERNHIKNKLTEQADVFRTQLQGLSPGTAPSLSMASPLSTSAQFIPGTDPEEPDEDFLVDAGEDLLNDIFEPREELQRQADMEDETFSRMSANLRGLRYAESQPVDRI
jgi:hypothetical protein|tara:strand:+ start:12448 stop:13422 length:975 start_codon:yes stop_codon:yes gene_type:complete